MNINKAMKKERKKKVNVTAISLKKQATTRRFEKETNKQMQSNTNSLKKWKKKI